MLIQRRSQYHIDGKFISNNQLWVEKKSIPKQVLLSKYIQKVLGLKFHMCFILSDWESPVTTIAYIYDHLPKTSRRSQKSEIFDQFNGIIQYLSLAAFAFKPVMPKNIHEAEEKDFNHYMFWTPRQQTLISNYTNREIILTIDDKSYFESVLEWKHMPMCSSVMTSMTYDRPMTRGRIRMMKTRSLVEDIKKTIMEIDETKQIHMQLKVQEQNVQKQMFNHLEDMELLKYKRIIFNSGYSTGKTVLMTECAEHLLKRNEHVLFIIHDGTNTGPTLLQGQLEVKFEKYSKMSIIRHNMAMGDKVLKNSKDKHIFIDELKYDHISSEMLHMWNSMLNENNYLWIVIRTCDKELDKESLSTVFHFPQLEYYLGTAPEIMRHAQKLAQKRKSSLDETWIDVKFPK